MASKFGLDTKVCVDNWRDIKKKKKDNKIVTTRYTWWSFLPVVLFEEFQKISNFYYLIVLMLNTLADSPAPIATTGTPVALLVGIAMITKLFEDIQRYKSDKEVNSQKTLILKKTEFKERKFESLNVGDVVKIVNDSFIPADILVLFTSKELNDCTVTTVSLDGESNLKAFNGTIDPIDEDELANKLINMRLEVHSIQPCEDLHKFNGRLIRDGQSYDESLFLTERNLLLRGTRLKNTEFVIGCVIYAGKDTKLYLNSQRKKMKLTAVERKLHRFVLCFLILQICLSIFCCIYWNLVYFTPQWTTANWYIPSDKLVAWTRVQGILNFFFLFARLLPITLIFSIYSQKVVACVFLNHDIGLYDERLNERARINTIELIDELGQIEYLFSDKTGTLTENKMDFHSCSLGQEVLKDKDKKLHLVKSPDCFEELPKPFEPDLMEFLLCLCLCHTVKASNPDGTSNRNFTTDVDTDVLLYQASSPDEEAFLIALRNYGIIYLGNKLDQHYVNVSGEIRKYTLVDVLEFDADRKCMSVIVTYPDGTNWLICKGSETALFERVLETSRNDILMDRLSEFCREGLRILVVGRRQMADDEVKKFQESLKTYRTDPSLVEKEHELYEDVEHSLALLGVTGVEDKLQEGVPETIRDLREAGIKVWVITGDKEETAVNISLSAGHITPDMHIHYLTKIDNIVECTKKLQVYSDLLDNAPDESQQHALVVDGQSFRFLSEPVLAGRFVQLCSRMQTTLCCRMNPRQKSVIVQVVKEHVKPRPITAAVGDGGNDVSMILEADLGIGIFGNEGRQAVRVADYSFGRFHFLRRAVLYHGQNFYIRLTTLINYYFYKSIIYVFSLVIYSFYTAFSSLFFYDTMVITFYNTTFTTIPVLLFGFFDKEESEEVRLKKPRSYREFRRNARMTYMRLFLSSIYGIFQCTCTFFLVYLLFTNNRDVIGINGNSFDIYFFGTIIFYCVWGLITVKLAMFSHYITALNIVCVPINIGFGFFLQMIYQMLSTRYDFSTSVNILAEPFSWFAIFVVVLICSIPDIFDKLHNDIKRKKVLLKRQELYEMQTKSLDVEE